MSGNERASAAGPDVELLEAPHALSADEALARLGTGRGGLSRTEAADRLARFGPNALPRARPAGVFRIFARQFRSPLIYILLLAALVSLLLEEWTDATFIAIVLLINAVIGTAQEHSAERSAEALQAMVVPHARVLRDGEDVQIDAPELVPGDMVLLESGDKVPADLRLVPGGSLQIDESLLTGESLAVGKSPESVLPLETSMGDRVNLAFAGSLVVGGRALGVVTATGVRTQLGRIAEAVLTTSAVKPPLLVRMDRFTTRIAFAVAAAVVLLAGVAFARGTPIGEVFFMAVALAVSAIPEGLPVALTVALSIGARRMSRRRVIARRLVAVEALGSCTYVASDKTGTLTLNEQTVAAIVLPGERPWTVTGAGIIPEGEVLAPDLPASGPARAAVTRLARAVALCNDGFLGRRDGGWVSHGDAVDVALLVFAHKAGVNRAELEAEAPRVAELAFEAERQYAVSANVCGGRVELFVKGAAERVLPMCARMATLDGDVPLAAALARRQADEAAAAGYRVLAVASGPARPERGDALSPDALDGLVLLGFIGMIDPLRPEARRSVEACHGAGITVAMVTGDHPGTSLAIARNLSLAERADEVVTGTQLAAAAQAGETALDALVRDGRVFARVEPRQKLEIVESLRRQGHFVAVTGDGANDAPALRVANIGIAMGGRGTDLARETADLILTDDDFSSIVAGVEEGRIAYGNVRKVIFLLISTGAAEVLLFLLAIAAGLPLPLLPAQLLWLNLVTNGIQDVALAFEPGEGGELQRRPRPPREPIFDRLMLQRTLLSAAVTGGIGFAVFAWLLDQGWEVDSARNTLLLLLVLFENVQAGNSRSETRSLLALSPLRNPILLLGTIAAQLIHIAAMYTPGLREVLRVEPVPLAQWAALLALALTLFVAMEVHKLVWRRSRRGGAT
ncbi:MAG TPA: HAD-IC family P-type ATPase [Gemmatimonadales bacterium]|nr:HAD-IC family P-type ATPase [Gemmatimonadales bacterium]